MNGNGTEIIWDVLKVKELVGNVKHIRKEVYPDKDTEFLVYVKGLKDTLNTMYGENFTNFVLDMIKGEGLLKI